jgi:hypothetical protein
LCWCRYKFLAEKCWAEMPELRPSLESLANELENLQKLLCPEVRGAEWGWGEGTGVLLSRRLHATGDGSDDSASMLTYVIH